MEVLKTELVQGNPLVLRVDGEIDIATADALQAALEEARLADPKFVVDMGGVTFFDAVGLRVVLQTARSQNGAGPLTLLNAPRVAWILDLVGLNELPSIVIRDEGQSDGR